MRATYRAPRADHYRRPGGPWDVGGLERALRTPTTHDTVLVDGAHRLGPHELVDAIDRVAAGLRRVGARAGSVVAWQTPNWFESVVLLRACWRIGAVAAPLLARAGPRDVEQIVDIVDPAVILAAPDAPLARYPGAIGVRADGGYEHVAGADPDPTPIFDRAASLALVMFTSGSTGRPKAVLHTHRSLLAKARAQGRVHGLVGHHTVLMPGPLGHVAGVLNGVTFPGVHGMKTVLMERWDADHGVALVHEEGVEFLGGPVAFLQGMVDSASFERSAVASLKVCSMGGSSITPTQIGELAAKLGCQVKRAYGSTEAPTITTTWAGDDVARGWSTDGRVTGEAEIRIVDPGARHDVAPGDIGAGRDVAPGDIGAGRDVAPGDIGAGRDVVPGDIGEIWLHGPELFAGYADPNDTAASVYRGWYRTGDLGSLDPQGFLTIAGRLKDLIIRGGENIANAEVELVLERHPHVKQAAVVGAPDPVLGERVAAFVVLSEPFDLAECRRWFDEVGVARYKTPEMLVELEALPLLATGKPDRVLLGERIAKEARPWT